MFCLATCKRCKYSPDLAIDSFPPHRSIDDELAGQAKTTSSTGVSRWVDHFVFDRYSHPTRLTISIRRIETRSGRSAPHGTVRLTLAQLLGSIGASTIRREPVVSEANGIVGHLCFRYRRIALDVCSVADGMATWKVRLASITRLSAFILNTPTLRSWKIKTNSATSMR